MSYSTVLMCVPYFTALMCLIFYCPNVCLIFYCPTVSVIFYCPNVCLSYSNVLICLSYSTVLMCVCPFHCPATGSRLDRGTSHSWCLLQLLTADCPRHLESPAELPGRQRHLHLTKHTNQVPWSSAENNVHLWRLFQKGTLHWP